MHVMLDFETLDTKTTAVCHSLGLVGFNADEILWSYKVHLSVEHQFKTGRTVSAQTLAWWLEQRDTPRAIMASALRGADAEHFYLDFAEPIRSDNFLIDLLTNNNPKLWGNGADFDIALLKSLLDQYAPSVHISHRNSRCYRTVSAMYQHLPKCVPSTAHDPVSDATAQAIQLIAINKYSEHKFL